MTFTRNPPWPEGYVVTARNSVGSSPPSILTVPDPPTNVSATAGAGKVTVFWNIPKLGYGYTEVATVTFIITANPGGLTTTAPYSSAAYFNGLTNGTAYTFTVMAVNPSGNSAPSSPSNSVTPS